MTQAPVTLAGDDVRPAAPSPAPSVVGRARRHLLPRLGRWAALGLFGLFFLVPLAALVEFSTRGVGLTSPRTLQYWQQITDYPDLVSAIGASLELAALTSLLALVLLVPTVVWTRLRAPRLARVVELLCLLPLAIPAIALVVGLAPIYQWLDSWLSYLVPGPLADTPLQLSLVYVVLVLPYCYRVVANGLSAIDVRTLADAARGLGAGWPTVIVRVIGPNLRPALLNAALLSVALVLGEYTVASLLNFPTLPVAVVMLGRENAGVSIAVSAAVLLLGFLLLLALSFVGRRAPGAATEEE